MNRAGSTTTPKSNRRISQAPKAKRSSNGLTSPSFAARTLSTYDRERPYLVGVSGGVDSMVLLHLLLRSGFKHLHVCHLNHNLRGTESRGDLEFVARLARNWKLPFYSKTLDQLPVGKSLETAAREARIQFFFEAAHHFDCAEVFLAHHANDQIETFLFNLLRGVGPIGNAGIKSESSMRLGGQELTLLRPLLTTWKAELLVYAQAHEVPYREDSSNTSLDMTRNRLRLEVLPMLERTLGRDVKPALLRSLDLSEGDEELLESLTPNLWKRKRLSVKALQSLPLSLERRVVRLWLKGQEVREVGFAEVEAVRSLAHQLKQAKINLPGGLHCRRKEGELFVEDSAK